MRLEWMALDITGAIGDVFGVEEEICLQVTKEGGGNMIKGKVLLLVTVDIDAPDKMEFYRGAKSVQEDFKFYYPSRPFLYSMEGIKVKRLYLDMDVVPDEEDQEAT